MMNYTNDMQAIFEIDSSRKTPKYLQIVHSVTKSIKLGKLKKGDRLLSINELSNEFLLARDTVQKAYNILEQDGILLPIKGKGFYIKRTDITVHFRILLVFNKISNYKKQVYDSFISTMGKKATVDLKIYHCNSSLFEDIVNRHKDEYDYFVVMPHFYENREEAIRLLREIPDERLIILDKEIDNMPGCYSSVYQDFENDIIKALEDGLELLRKYNRLVLVFPKLPQYPIEIVNGFRAFCMQNNFRYAQLNEINNYTEINPKEAYIVIEESDLVTLIKRCRALKFEPGNDIGIISYNDTPLKEILLDGITVISTDHSKMGESAARLILDNRKEKIRNPFSLIIRKSL